MKASVFFARRSAAALLALLLGCGLLAGCAAPQQPDTSDSVISSTVSGSSESGEPIPVPEIPDLIQAAGLDDLQRADALTGLTREELYEAWGQPDETADSAELEENADSDDDPTAALYHVEEDTYMAVVFKKDNTVRIAHLVNRSRLLVPQQPMTDDTDVTAYPSWCVRTDGSGTGAFPVVTVLRTAQQLQQYLEENGGCYALENGFAAQVAGYDDSWFADHALVLVALQANTGSVRYTVVGLSGDGRVRLNAETPEYSTADMAQFHIGIEVPADAPALQNAQLSVDFGAGAVTPVPTDPTLSKQ